MSFQFTGDHASRLLLLEYYGGPLKYDEGGPLCEQRCRDSGCARRNGIRDTIYSSFRSRVPQTSSRRWVLVSIVSRESKDEKRGIFEVGLCTRTAACNYLRDGCASRTIECPRTVTRNTQDTSAHTALSLGYSLPPA